MRHLLGITIDTNNVVSIAAGETWANVYSTLDSKGPAVVGGRVSEVGVTGLILGGGLSYFSEATGFVCDNVINFEVVLSNGDIIQANKDSNADLFRALKGGTNNFGLVTKIVLPAFPHGQMWGGTVYYDASTYPDIVNAFYNFASNPTPDPEAHVIAATVYSPAGPVNVVNPYCTTPTAQPSSLAPFTAIQPQLANTLRHDSLLGFAAEQAAFSTNGTRQLFFTTSFRLNKQFMLDIHDLFDKTIENLKDVPGLTLSMVFQPLTKHMLQQSAAKGSNSLGLSPNDGPLVITLLNSVHLNAADDSKVITATSGLQENITALARERGLNERYRFMNYAFRGQDVIESYGLDNVHFLQSVSRKYDPDQFFQSRVPGGFKLSHSS